MSIPLTDFRCKVTPEIDALLDTLHRTTGKDKSEIARDVLHKWALLEIHAAMILHGELKSKGVLRDYEGASGK
jgi:hypothetical protein